MLTRPASWLTAKRVRIHGLLLAVCLWTTYAVDISTPGLRDRYGLVKGTDFLHFYTLGCLALRGRGDLLYDMRAQAIGVRERIPEAAEVFYLPLYGPQVSLLFAPLARLPYGWALTAWLSFNVVIYALCFKPEVALSAAAIFLFSGEWRTVLGAISAAAAQLALAWAHYGTSVMRSYLQALSRIREVAPLLEPRLYQTHSLRSFWSLLLP